MSGRVQNLQRFSHERRGIQREAPGSIRGILGPGPSRRAEDGRAPRHRDDVFVLGHRPESGPHSSPLPRDGRIAPPTSSTIEWGSSSRREIGIEELHSTRLVIDSPRRAGGHRERGHVITISNPERRGRVHADGLSGNMCAFLMMFLYSLPNWLMGVVIIATIMALMYAGYFAFHRGRRPSFTDDNRNLAMAVLAVIATLNSLLLAFSGCFGLGIVRRGGRGGRRRGRTPSARSRAICRSSAAPRRREARQAAPVRRDGGEGGMARHAAWRRTPVSGTRSTGCSRGRAVEPDTPRRVALLPEILARVERTAEGAQNQLYTSQSEVPGTLWAVVLMGTADHDCHHVRVVSDAVQPRDDWLAGAIDRTGLLPHHRDGPAVRGEGEHQPGALRARHRQHATVGHRDRDDPSDITPRSVVVGTLRIASCQRALRFVDRSARSERPLPPRCPVGRMGSGRTDARHPHPIATGRRRTHRDSQSMTFGRREQLEPPGRGVDLLWRYEPKPG